MLAPEGRLVGRAPRPTVLREGGDDKRDDEQRADNTFGSPRERPIVQLQTVNHDNLQDSVHTGLDARSIEKV